MHLTSSLGSSTKADGVLLSFILVLAVIGLISVASSSFFLAEHLTGSGTYFFIRQALHLALAFVVALVAYTIPPRFIESVSPLILLGVIGLLVLVLVPGIGKSVNGAYRWISLGGINIQVSEAAKLGIVLYLAGYIHRKQILIQDSIQGALVPLCVMGLVALLVLLEPDFGGAVIILTIGIAMLFYAGLPWRMILLLVVMLLVTMAALAYFSPYRLARLTAFFNPWENPFGDSYQLTQSLMAVGRGGIWGVGLGYGLQKQLYLPEGHTDFIYAVMSEEIGLVGSSLIMLCFLIILFRGFYWVYIASRKDNCYEAMCIFGIMVWWGVSCAFSMSVNLGLVPTKGIALPFISYGGSNLLVNACAAGIVLRITKGLSGT